MDLSAVRDHDPASVTDEQQEAAVLAPVVERAGEPQLIFTKRAEHLPNHPGQMSFPGGRREPEDGSLRDTATREAEEEVGIDPAAVDVVGRLDDIRTVTRFSVRPFVARVPAKEYSSTSHEVAEVVPLSVADLTARNHYESEHREHPHHGRIRLHYFSVDGYTVWGATARILVQLLELATDWTVPAEVDRVVEPDADFPV